MKNFIEALLKQNEVIAFRYKETTSLFVSTKFHSYFLFFFFDNMEDMVDMMECSGDIWTCLKEQRNIYNNNMDKNTLCICCLEVSDEEYYKTEETCGLSDLSKYIGKIEEDLSYFSKHVLLYTKSMKDFALEQKDNIDSLFQEYITKEYFEKYKQDPRSNYQYDFLINLFIKIPSLNIEQYYGMKPGVQFQSAEQIITEKLKERKCDNSEVIKKIGEIEELCDDEEALMQWLDSWQGDE